MTITKFLIFFVFFLSGLISCTDKFISKKIQNSTILSKNHSGFYLYDIEKHKILAKHNADRYFTPASTTKIFTFYAGLETLSDSVAALHYAIHGDSLLFWGTGDPSGLNYSNKALYSFLKNTKKQLFFSDQNFTGSFYGLGWAWEDYNEPFATEISPLPLYANKVYFSTKKNGKLTTYPSFFQEKIYHWGSSKEFKIQRDLYGNLFSCPIMQIKQGFRQNIPYKTSTALTIELLKDTLKKDIVLVDNLLEKESKTIYSLPTDSLYKKMLHASDNFIAEQLILLISDKLTGELSTEKGIKSSREKYLTALPDSIVWVDGSGTSRYNLATPRALAFVLEKIYNKIPRERLFHIFPAAGNSGTILTLMSLEKKKPYVFAKSGSFNNTYNLSGYLVTKKGKVLLFSFLNNNFVLPTATIKKEIAGILNDIYEKY